jgi:hypothetical protein
MDAGHPIGTREVKASAVQVVDSTGEYGEKRIPQSASSPMFVADSRGC